MASATTVEQTAASTTGRGRLLKVLGVAFGVAVIIGNTIGSGILRTPSSVASLLPNQTLFVLAWVAGGVYALLGTMSLAELGILVPRSGGQYVYAQRAFGAYAGFIIGWSDWVSTVASFAAAAILIGDYAGALVPALSRSSLAVGIAVVAVFTVLQYRGVKWGDRTQQVTTLLKAVAFVALIIACFTLTPVSTPAVTAATAPTTALTFASVVLAMQAVIYTYDGWNGMLYFSEELKDPGREIPRGMFVGVAAIIGIYVLVNVAFVHVLGMDGLARSDFAAGATAQALFGGRGDEIIRILLIVGLFSGANAYIMFCPRILYAMSLDGLFPKWGTTVNEGGTPTYTLLLSAALAIAFLLTGTFNSVIAVAAFYFVLNYVFSFAAVFKLRRTMADAPRPYKAIGFPFTTAFSLLGGVSFLIGAIVTDRKNSLVSIALLAVSYPIFALTMRARRSS